MSVTSSPGARSRTWAVSDSAPLTGSSSMATTTSSVRSPASAAGPPAVASTTTAPSRTVPSAVRAVPSARRTPRNACAAAPSSTSSVATRRARFAGIAKPSPMDPLLRDVVRMDEVIPTTRPLASKSGPPLLPGLIAASTWIAFVTTGSPRPGDPVDTGRSTADTMPVVAVLSRPSGLPTAMTGSPTATSSESPNAAATRSSGGSVSAMTATSVVGSVPTTSAS